MLYLPTWKKLKESDIWRFLTLLNQCVVEPLDWYIHQSWQITCVGVEGTSGGWAIIWLRGGEGCGCGGEEVPELESGAGVDGELGRRVWERRIDRGECWTGGLGVDTFWSVVWGIPRTPPWSSACVYDMFTDSLTVKITGHWALGGTLSGPLCALQYFLVGR